MAIKKHVVVLALLIALLLNGCFSTKEPYAFKQEADQITAIEIVKKQYDSTNEDAPYDVLMVLEKTQYQEFVRAVHAVDGRRMGLDPLTGFGLYYVRVIYHDGAIEAFGAYSNGYYSPDGTFKRDCYGFDIDEFCAMLSVFLGYEIAYRS